jgi:hypothetical protein
MREAKRRGTQKYSRTSYPAFEIVLEINHPNSWTILCKTSVDLLLQVISFWPNKTISLVEKNTN